MGLPSYGKLPKNIDKDFHHFYVPSLTKIINKYKGVMKTSIARDRLVSIPFEKTCFMTCILEDEEGSPNYWAKIYVVEGYSPTDLQVQVVEVLTENIIAGCSFGWIEKEEKYGVSALEKFPDLGDNGSHQVAVETCSFALSQILYHINCGKCSYLNETLEKTKKLKDRFGRSLSGISEIIHIVPSEEKGRYKGNITPGRAEFRHRFEVMGHWRKIKGKVVFGKNRNGEYCIKGYTWVNGHIRGSEDMPLVKKRRVVHAE